MSKKPIFPELIKDPVYDFHVWLAKVFSVDQDIVQIYDHKDVKLFGEDLIDIALEASWSIRKSKRYDLILKMAVSGLKNSFLFIVFLNSHLMIGID